MNSHQVSPEHLIGGITSIPIVLRMCMNSRTFVDADTGGPPALMQMPALTLTRTPSYYFCYLWCLASPSICKSYDSGIRGSLHCVALTPTDVEIAAHLRSLLHRDPLLGLFEHLLNHTKYLSYGGRWISFVCGDQTPKGFSRNWVEESGNWIPMLLRAR